MKIQAKVIADSITNDGDRITTMVVTMPRFILAEFNTHRVFSRNTSSSRAIPYTKMVKSIQDDPVVPIAWQKDHKGMQGTEYFTDAQQIEHHKTEWLNQRSWAVLSANSLALDGVTKQIINRLLEPWMWCTVIVTATEWENFFALRCPQYKSEGSRSFRSKKDAVDFINEANGSDVKVEDYDDLHWLAWNKGQAEIHMMALAEAMWDEYNNSVPAKLNPGDWHIPFAGNADIKQMHELFVKGIGDADWNITRVKIATAMCARTSYTIVGEEDKFVNYENDIKLHDRLLEAKHMSPFEHCAKAPDLTRYHEEWPKGFTHKDMDGHMWSGNFKWWIQYRQLIEHDKV